MASTQHPVKLSKSLASGKTGSVVMELFTSQGCSSCPEADEILGNYAQLNDERIIPLSFHVDYWNRLGWVDSFSRADYTARQNEYASKFALESIYTPQLIINGKAQLIGSDKAGIFALVANELKENATANILIRKTSVTGKNITVNFVLDVPVFNASIKVALVQEKAITYIRAGENKGKRLINYNVVRDFNSVKLKEQSGNSILHLPPGNTKAGYQVVLFVQDDGTGKILTAARAGL
jgi:hypothetical protein